VSGNESKIPINGSVLVPPSATPNFVDNTVAAGVVYYYEITAVLNGVESLDSVQVKSAPVPFSPSPTGIQLGVASSFGVLAGSTVTNTGATSIIGDVGVSPGTAITGFGAPASITGVFHAGDFVAAAAQQDLTTAYNAAAAALNPSGLFPPVTTSYVVTSVATSTGGSALYTGTFTAASLAGQTITFSGFTNASNNGAFTISASTATTVTVNNPIATAETASAVGMALSGGGTTAVTLPADIGGKTLTPGVYNVASSLAITGNVILDAQGNQDAVFVFQIGSTLVTAASNSTVSLAGGASASNVFWQVGSSATLGVATAFSGIIMAQASITVGTGASVNGQLLARTGAVTLDTNDVSLFIPGVLVLGGRQKHFDLGNIFFDCVTNTYQEVILAGTTCSGPPPSGFNPVIGGTTLDCGVTWLTLDPPVGTLLPLPPSPPNVPPAPPAAPLNPRITSEA